MNILHQIMNVRKIALLEKILSDLEINAKVFVLRKMENIIEKNLKEILLIQYINARKNVVY